MSKFRKATRQKVKACIMIEGLAGTGKSGLALAIAHALANKEWDKVFAIDAENQSLDLFEQHKLHTGEPVGAFNKADIDAVQGYAPSKYDTLRQEAIEAGAEVLIIDSMSHMWNREGGLLDRVSALSKSASGRDFNAWQTPEIVKEKTLIFDLLRSNKVHTISTVRNKEKFSMERNDTTNKNEVVSLGEQQVQQEGLKYEPDLVLRMESAGTDGGQAPKAKVLKSRYTPFKLDETYEFNQATLDVLVDYLSKGVDPQVLEDKQKEELIKEIKDFGRSSKMNMSLWKATKKDAGHEETSIEDIPFHTLKKLYYQIVQE